MAFKEYSVNDFLYSGFKNVTDDYCNTTNLIVLDDLINKNCNEYTTTPILVNLNNITYTFTPTETTLNTIQKIADKFTEMSRFIFSYDNNYNLIVKSAKYQNSTVTENSTSETLANTITIAGKVYTINKPVEGRKVASSSNNIVFDTGFRYWTSSDKNNKKNIITPPTITYKTTIKNTETITGRFDNVNKKYVCNILPGFALEFTDKDSGPTLVYSESKYVKYSSEYHTFPKVVSGPESTNVIDKCSTAKQNRALCTNKAYADKLMALTGTHPGASERYDDIRSFTNMSILNIFNLGIGIVATGVFIAQTYK
jgi:hypothetical protein